MKKLTLAQLTKIQEIADGDQNLAYRLKAEAESKIKDVTIAYVLGAILGGFGAHRIYTGQLIIGFLQFVSVLCIIGWLWVLADVVLTKLLIDDVNDKIVNEVIDQHIILNGSKS
ncbi:TMhelix containing protein [Vibrio phage 1.187.O._10N.286.49.F1]|nr:TMhelix containing protein [Vibrio phage 1.187.O._10N.286.49.F1]